MEQKQAIEISPELRSHLKDALYHMTAMWDALSQLETPLVTVESDQISPAASMLCEPSDAYQMTDEDVDEILEQIYSETE